jgi:hypothetical protein
MSRYTRRRRWVETAFAAAGAGFVAVGLQPDHAPWWRYAMAFAGAALPVLAVHARHGQAAAEPMKAVSGP